MICNFARQIHNCVLQHVSLIRKICVMLYKLHPLCVLNRYMKCEKYYLKIIWHYDFNQLFYLFFNPSKLLQPLTNCRQSCYSNCYVSSYAIARIRAVGMWHLLNMHISADQKTRIINMAPRCQPSGTNTHTHAHTHSWENHNKIPPANTKSSKHHLCKQFVAARLIIFRIFWHNNYIFTLNHAYCWDTETLHGSLCVARAGKHQEFLLIWLSHTNPPCASLLSFFHSSISTLLSGLFSLFPCFLSELRAHTHTHTHTLCVHYFCYAIQWPGGSSEDRHDCCWPDIKKYLMGPHTHARTHLWSMRLSTATIRNTTYESHSHLYCFLRTRELYQQSSLKFNFGRCFFLSVSTGIVAQCEIVFVRFWARFSTYHLSVSCLAPRTVGQIAPS